MANLSDKFFEVLSDYPGSVQDRMKAYLVSTYSYDSSLNVYDMEFLVLRDLGYTGTLDDMWKAYLVSLGGSGVSSKAALLGSTFYAGAGYSVNGLNPAYVTDFGAEFYRKSGATSTFSDSITHSASSNATMVDSDGLLKWRPHNLSTGDTWDAASGDVSSSAGFLVLTSTVSGNLVSSPEVHTHVVEVKSAGWDFAQVNINQNSTFTNINLSTGAAGSSSGTTSIEDVGDGWWRVTLVAVPASGSSALRVYKVDDASAARNAIKAADVDGEDIRVRYPRVYRSDLGGMVNNPDRGDSYVPTTSSAVYLPRRGHHVYNGDSWVNKGLLHESEARTNLALYSRIASGGVLKSGWIVQGATASATTSTAPDGSTDGATISITTNAGNNLNRQISGLTIGQTYTASMWLKGVAGQQIYFIAEDTAAAQELITFTGDWQRVSKTYTATSTTQYLACEIFDRSAGAHLPNVTFEVWGGQYELGSTPSSYIPTSGATVTRSAETLTVPAANLPWPSPVVIGEELAPQDTSTTSGWSVFEVSPGAVTGTAQGLRVFSPAGETAIVGIQPDSTKVYKVEYTVEVVAGQLEFRATKGEVHGVGTHTRTVYTTTGPSGFLWARAGLTTDAYVRNISVKEINPLSVSIQMQGEMTYADLSDPREVIFSDWGDILSNGIQNRLSTSSGGTGGLQTLQGAATVIDAVNSVDSYSPGVNVPFNIASRHGSTFVNGAVDGTALTADLTPVALPDLSATDLQLGYDYMGTISLFRVWADDLTDAGIAEASAPSTVPSLSLTFDGLSTSFTDGGLVV